MGFGLVAHALLVGEAKVSALLTGSDTVVLLDAGLSTNGGEVGSLDARVVRQGERHYQTVGAQALS